MTNQADSISKQREIAFCTLHPDANQAGTAAALLIDHPGIDKVELLSSSLIKVHYQITHTYLADIETVLSSTGFHLDNHLMQRMRRALVHYVEDTQRTNMGCSKGESNCTAKIFINDYQKRSHGCQDDRPKHWRRYL